MRRVLILGGGFGGLAAAHRLRELLPEAEVTVVDRRAEFFVGFRKTWSLLGQSELREFSRPLSNLERRGIRFVQGPIDALDPAAKTVLAGGQELRADALVLALGAELDSGAVTGFEQFVFNVYDPAAIPDTRKALQGFTGGRIGIGIFGDAYKCPPAPYELAFLLREHLQERSIDAQIEVFTPKPMSLPVLGDAGCSVVEGRLADKGISFLPSHRAKSISAGEVQFESGTRSYDLLLGVPPHRCPAIAHELTDESGWVQVDLLTMETRFEDVYAVGDMVRLMLDNGKPHPKAGIFAEQQGKVVAERIAAVAAGRQPQATYQGHGHCFLELGGGQAMLVRGDFTAPGGPQVELTEPSAEYMQQKLAFESERLDGWLAA